MSRSVKIRLQFNGSKYLGWQSQKDSSPTVQDTFNEALANIYKIKSVKTLASGRTDSGVHSLDHHVKFDPPFFIENEKLVRALNSNLPKDIRVICVDDIDEKFKPTSSARSREYRYLFTNNAIESAFQRDFIVNVPYQLDFELMKRACKLFVGEHDFSSYCTQGSEVSTKIRTIFECELEYNECNMHGIMPDHYYIKITGSGFLKQMVRLIVGVIWDVGQNKLSLDDVAKSLAQASGEHLSAVAKPQGLYKVKVDY